jgi:pilus assembly protein FimV
LGGAVKNYSFNKFKQRTVVLAVASCLSLAPWYVQAAGLGKITVYSGIGQPLKAELEVNATREELAGGLSARLASQDAFNLAGIDYSSVLYDLRFTLDKRPDGKPVVKLSSTKPINEPFLDFLVELNWASGRLVREYTFLLDPPEVAVKSSSRPVSVAEAKVVDSVPGGGSAGEVKTPPPARPAPAAAAPAVAPEPKPAAAPAKPAMPASASTAASGSYPVKPGDTLAKIALATKPAGVSLEQMLVGLYQYNQEAFSGNNINRLKAGAILSLPDPATVEAVSPEEAKKIVVTQSRDWNAYRQKLASAVAAAPAKADAPAEQAAAGKITPKVEDKALPAEKAKDQVKVSRSEDPAKMAADGKRSGVSEEERIARERELKEANERVTLLEKNVNELQRLIEMKNQQLAEVQKQSLSKPEASAPAKPAEPPVAPAKPAEPVKPEAAPVAKPAEPPPATEAAKPAEPPAPPPAPAPKPPAAKKPLPPPEPPPEPSLVDSLLEDPLPLAGGGGILVLLLAYALMKRRRASAAAEATTTGPLSAGSSAKSMFGVNGGQSIDTSNTPPQTGEFSQTGPGTIDTDEVDPVAEADVYMAYGRDAQAEEILLEALQKDPQRLAIHVKLLEIYANRNSLKQFETLASELYGQTGGIGPEWEKVSALGAGLDPSNPLYSRKTPSTAQPAFDADATLVVSPAAAAAAGMGAAAFAAVDTASAGVDLDLGALEPAAAAAADVPADFSAEVDLSLAVAEPEPVADDSIGLDFDLGSPAPEPAATPAAPLPEIEVPSLAGDLEESADANALDFDLGMVEPVAQAASTPALKVDAPAELADTDLSVDFDISVPAPKAPMAEPEFSPEGTMVMPESQASLAADGVDLDLDMPEFDTPVEKASAPSVMDIDLDVAEPTIEALPVDSGESAADITDMDFGVDALTPPAPAADTATAEAAEETAMSFDLSLDGEAETEAAAPMPTPNFDIGSINLDLSVDESAPLEEFAELPEPADFSGDRAESGAPAAIEDDPLREEIKTKLDLAKAYEEMGDLEGARELLAEVVGEGPIDLADLAREALARIS